MSYSAAVIAAIAAAAVTAAVTAAIKQGVKLSKSKITHVYNNTDYTAIVYNKEDGREWTLENDEFAKIRQEGKFYLKIKLPDKRKKVTVSSHQNESWIIVNEGVVRQRMGQALDEEDSGPLFQWKKY